MVQNVSFFSFTYRQIFEYGVKLSLSQSLFVKNEAEFSKSLTNLRKSQFRKIIEELSAVTTPDGRSC